jgi:ectoine hydroxylase-related dioxygenase (phytanoyl-CoA dioxygenase family)
MSLLGTLKTINKKLGNPAKALGPMREVIEPKMRMLKWEADRRARERRYPLSRFTFDRHEKIVADIERDGYAIVKNAVPKEMLLQILKEAEAHLDAGTSLVPVSRDSARKKGDLTAANKHLSPEELKMGQAYFRQHTNYISIANPATNAPTVWKAAFHPLLTDVAFSYLNCVPAVGGLNLRKSYVNDLPEFDTLYFHVDPNSPKFLKFFFYLNDVDKDGGPFCYVRGSHKKRFPGWRSKGRWTLEEMEREYGRENILDLTANLGDMIVADTNGFHRGTKVVARDRFMLTVDYAIHEEFEGTQDRSMFQLPQSVFKQMSPKQQAIADFLQIA